MGRSTFFVEFLQRGSSLRTKGGYRRLEHTCQAKGMNFGLPSPQICGTSRINSTAAFK